VGEDIFDEDYGEENVENRSDNNLWKEHISEEEVEELHADAEEHGAEIEASDSEDESQDSNAESKASDDKSKSYNSAESDKDVRSTDYKNSNEESNQDQHEKKIWTRTIQLTSALKGWKSYSTKKIREMTTPKKRSIF